MFVAAGAVVNEGHDAFFAIDVGHAANVRPLAEGVWLAEASYHVLHFKLPRLKVSMMFDYRSVEEISRRGGAFESLEPSVVIRRYITPSEVSFVDHVLPWRL